MSERNPNWKTPDGIEGEMARLARDVVREIVDQGEAGDFEIVGVNENFVGAIRNSAAVMRDLMDRNLIFVHSGSLESEPLFAADHIFVEKTERPLLEIKVHPRAIGIYLGIESDSEIKMNSLKAHFFTRTMPSLIGIYNTLLSDGYTFEPIEYGTMGWQEL